ncbi:MAG: CehA/McbA family metallohydrolase [Acidimicrobiales bacterium]
MRARHVAASVALGAAMIAPLYGSTVRARAHERPLCMPGGPPVTFSGEVAASQARSYIVRPFEVAPGTTRVDVTYDWADKPPALPPTPLTQTVFDLGLWDNHGYRAAQGFRGWSGSRAGRVAAGQPPVFIQQDIAQRGYLPGTIEPGVWWVEIGVAAVGPTGAIWTAAVTCTDPDVGTPFTPDPVDPDHVARPDPGWYHGDFHMHGFHSNPRAPDWADMVREARDVRALDFLPITDYVTVQHQRELGPVQRAFPDVLIWPGREVITYFGHANALGETPNEVEYRHGFEDVSLGDVQAGTIADGALFQVNHPTSYPGPVFANFCRGCEFTLDGAIDLDEVATMEVLTGPALVDPSALGGPSTPVRIENPFMRTAIDRWEALLLAGHRITAVSGSDSKGVEGEGRRWGTNATAVYAEELSRPALVASIRAGHAYVRTRGVHASPALELTAVAPDGETGMFGDSFTADHVQVRVTVNGGRGELLQVTRNGTIAGLPVLITSDPFSYTFTATRVPAEEGPLGTFWRVDTFDLQSLTAIGNPIFLTGPAPRTP